MFFSHSAPLSIKFTLVINAFPFKIQGTLVLSSKPTHISASESIRIKDVSSTESVAKATCRIQRTHFELRVKENLLSYFLGSKHIDFLNSLNAFKTKCSTLCIGGKGVIVFLGVTILVTRHTKVCD